MFSGGKDWFSKIMNCPANDDWRDCLKYTYGVHVYKPGEGTQLKGNHVTPQEVALGAVTAVWGCGSNDREILGGSESADGGVEGEGSADAGSVEVDGGPTGPTGPADGGTSDVVTLEVDSTYQLQETPDDTDRSLFAFEDTLVFSTNNGRSVAKCHVTTPGQCDVSDVNGGRPDNYVAVWMTPLKDNWCFRMERAAANNKIGFAKFPCKGAGASYAVDDVHLADGTRITDYIGAIVTGNGSDLTMVTESEGNKYHITEIGNFPLNGATVQADISGYGKPVNLAKIGETSALIITQSGKAVFVRDGIITSKNLGGQPVLSTIPELGNNKFAVATRDSIKTVNETDESITSAQLSWSPIDMAKGAAHLFVLHEENLMSQFDLDGNLIGVCKVNTQAAPSKFVLIQNSLRFIAGQDVKGVANENLINCRSQ